MIVVVSEDTNQYRATNIQSQDQEVVIDEAPVVMLHVRHPFRPNLLRRETGDVAMPNWMKHGEVVYGSNLQGSKVDHHLL